MLNIRLTPFARSTAGEVVSYTLTFDEARHSYSITLDRKDLVMLIADITNTIK